MKNKYIIKKVLTICFVLIAILTLIYFCLKHKKTNKGNLEVANSNQKSEQNVQNLEPVKSATAFFTVQSCINKYINYILEKDSESVYKVLDYEYINENKITKSNVLDKVNVIDEQVVFEASKMYLDKIDENNNRYYVSGILKQEDFGYSEGINIIDDKFKIVVILNLEDMIFSIIPIEGGGIFNEENS